MTTPTETNRKLRGHRFYLTPAELAQVPRLEEQDGKGDEAVVHVHYFSAAGDWWLTEIDEDGQEAFGFVRLHSIPEGAEWGSVWLPELEELKVMKGPFPIYVERDLYWTPQPMGEVLDKAGVR